HAAEDLAKEGVGAVSRMGVGQLLDRKIRPREFPEHTGGPRALQHGIADLAVEVLEDRGLHQEVKSRPGETCQELVPQIVGDESVTAAEARNIDAVPLFAERQSGEVEHRRPSLSQLM